MPHINREKGTINCTVFAQVCCEKFADYLLGAKLTIATDHKPLVPLFTG